MSSHPIVRRSSIASLPNMLIICIVFVASVSTAGAGSSFVVSGAAAGEAFVAHSGGSRVAFRRRTTPRDGDGGKGRASFGPSLLSLSSGSTGGAATPSDSDDSFEHERWLCHDGRSRSRCSNGDLYEYDRRGALLGGLQRLSIGGIFGSALLASELPAVADAAVTVAPPPPLLSNYDPLSFTVRPEAGRTLFPPSFLPPLGIGTAKTNQRATYRYSLGRNAWRLEQLLAFANVTATIATSVVKLDDGGLWVHGPLWPTGEYAALLDELGPVKHVVLPANALEHKAPLQAFVKRYPDAEVWIAPGQYGPFGSCGTVTADMTRREVERTVTEARKTMGHRVDGILPIGDAQGADANRMLLPPWADELDTYTLYADLPENAGPVSEAAFVHRSTRTLFVTDAVVCVPDVDVGGGNSNSFPIQPIFRTYFPDTTVDDDTFWPRTVLQAVFLPLRTNPDDPKQYPGYDALKNRLVRAPILRAFADARAPEAVRAWVESIVRGNSGDGRGGFDRIVSSHFASPVNAGPALFEGAFAHLRKDATSLSSSLPPITCQDWSTLEALNDFIETNKLGAPVVYDYKAGCEKY